MPRLSPLALAMASLLVGSPLLAAPFAHSVDEGAPDRPRMVLAPRPAEEGVMVISFPVGSVDDGFRSGLTRLTQRMLIDGNAREPRGALWRDLHAAAAELAITTEARRSTFRLRAPKDRFTVLAQRVLEAVFTPKLDRRQLARVKRLTRNEQLPPGGREHALSFLGSAVLPSEDGGALAANYGSGPYGDEESLARLRFEDVEEHLGSRLTPANATVTITGAFAEARLARKVASFEGGERQESARLGLEADLPLSFELDAARERYVRAQVLTLKTPEQAAAARLLAALLEERLENALRAKGVSVEPEAFVQRGEGLDLLVLYIPLHAGRGTGVEGELSALLDGLREGRFVQGEFERNRAHALATLVHDDKDPARLADGLDAAGRVPWHGEAVRGSLEGMAQAVFLAHARAWLDDKRGIQLRFAPGARGQEPR